MELAGDRKKSSRFVVFTSLASFIGALLLLQLTWADQIENRAYDSYFRLFHRLVGGVSAPQVGFVSIDDKSIDPDYSDYSSPMGRDGWLTRDTWDKHLIQMGQIYQPKVLAYDILFSPIPSNSVPDDEKNVGVVRTLESKGNDDLLNELIEFDDLRSQGLPAPRVLFAYNFPDDQKTEKRLLDKTPLGKPLVDKGHTYASEEEKQVAWFKKLDRFRLPPGSIKPGGNLRVFYSVRLPMEEILSSPSYYLGSINIRPDTDGVYRRAPMIYAYKPPDSNEVRYVPSFDLEAFLLWLDIEPQDLKAPGQGLPSISAQPGGELKITTKQGEWTLPVDDQFRMSIVPRFAFNQRGQDELLRDSFVDLLLRGLDKTKAGENPHLTDEPAFKRKLNEDDQVAALMRGKILVVGEAFTGGTDMGNYPLEEAAPNAVFHVHILSNILRNDHLVNIHFVVKALICAGLAGIMAFLYIWPPIRLPGLWSITLIISYPILAGVALISYNQQLPLVAPSFVCFFCFGLNSYHIYRLTRQGREAMRRLFSSVTSPRVLRLLEENPDAFYVHRKTAATMLFSDVEGFTSLAEKLDPDYLATLINRYLSPMTEIIIRHDGYLDKYSGDGIMAIWGAPLPDAGHAYKACIAAWEQIQAANALTETLPDGSPYRFRVRIGVNTGQVSAGNMGSAQKMQYTVMGDEVNLAARLEPANKDYGTQIVLGPDTVAAARERIRVRTLDKIIVKGRTEAVLIYELLGMSDAPAPGEWLVSYEKGLELLWRRQWDEADQMFERAIRLRGGDPPSELQRERIRDYRQNPPGPEWQGEFARLAKD